MKATRIASLIIALGIFFLLGCDQTTPEDPLKGNVSFGFFQPSSSNARALSDSLSLSAVVVSVASTEGEVIYDREELELLKFGGQYVSEVLQLNLGSYQLEEFFVLDESGEVVFASPKEGSELAQLVDEPLPLSFGVNATDSVTYLTPEVLEVSSSTPAEFGYAAFGYQIVETIDFYTSAFLYYDSSSFELTDAKLTVLSSSGDSAHYDLAAKPNLIRVGAGVSEYYLIFMKSGYPNQVDTLTVEELSEYSGISYNVYFGSADCKDEFVELDGLIAYFQANNSLQDVYGNYNAELHNGSFLGTDLCGRVESAFSLTGETDLILFNGLLDSVSNLQQGSFSFWFSPSEDQMDKQGTVFGFSNTSGPTHLQSFYCVLNSDNHLSFHLWKDGYFNNRAWVIQDSTVLVEGNGWYHVVLTQDGTQARAYVNGVENWNELNPSQQYDRGAWIGDIIGGINVIMLGSHGTPENPLGNPNGNLDAKYDNVSFYNRALTSDEVQILYNAYGR